MDDFISIHTFTTEFVIICILWSIIDRILIILIILITFIKSDQLCPVWTKYLSLSYKSDNVNTVSKKSLNRAIRRTYPAASLVYIQNMTPLLIPFHNTFSTIITYTLLLFGRLQLHWAYREKPVHSHGWRHPITDLPVTLAVAKGCLCAGLHRTNFGSSHVPHVHSHKATHSLMVKARRYWYRRRVS